MTYNPDDWQPGDIVLMEVDMSLLGVRPLYGETAEEVRERNAGPQVRMLAWTRWSDGTRNLAWQGPNGAVHHSPMNLRAIRSIQRLATITPEQLAARELPF